VLTPDEQAVRTYVQWLQAENKRLAAVVELSVLDSPLAPSDAPATSQITTTADICNAPPAAPETLSPTGIANVCNEPDASAEESARSKRDLAEAELLRDPTGTNVGIGELLGCSREVVRQARARLEAAGRLQPTPVVRRDGTSYPAREAVADGQQN
jgi:hypothetical protein